MIWTECVMSTAYLSNLISTKLSLKILFELLHGTRQMLHTSLKMFGEVGVVTLKDKIQAKLTNQGIKCIFVGHAKNH